MLGCGHRVFSEQEQFLITHMTQCMNFTSAVTIICNYTEILKIFTLQRRGQQRCIFIRGFYVSSAHKKLVALFVVLGDNFSYPMEDTMDIYGFEKGL